MHNCKKIFQTENPPENTTLLFSPFSEAEKLVTSTLLKKTQFQQSSLLIYLCSGTKEVGVQ